jgi:hypothetical protein
VVERSGTTGYVATQTKAALSGDIISHLHYPNRLIMSQLAQLNFWKGYYRWFRSATPPVIHEDTASAVKKKFI